MVISIIETLNNKADKLIMDIEEYNLYRSNFDIDGHIAVELESRKQKISKQLETLVKWYYYE